MAITIGQMLNYSWMSQASYLEFAGRLKTDPIEKLVTQLTSERVRSFIIVR